MKKVTIKLTYEEALVLSYFLEFSDIVALVKGADDDMKTPLSYIIKEKIEAVLSEATKESNSKPTWRTETLRAACNIELKNKLTGFEYSEEHIATPDISDEEVEEFVSQMEVVDEEDLPEHIKKLMKDNNIKSTSNEKLGY
jgi:hypothetical protein